MIGVIAKTGTVVLALKCDRLIERKNQYPLRKKVVEAFSFSLDIVVFWMVKKP
jgi:hypothetical protein